LCYLRRLAAAGRGRRRVWEVHRWRMKVLVWGGGEYGYMHMHVHVHMHMCM
jgi:hypothetical protein